MTGLLTVLPADVLAAVEAEATDLETYFAGLSDADLQRPSACPEWTVGDVIAHLARQAHSYAAAIRRALQGDTRPPEEPSAPSTGSVSGDIAARAKLARQQIGGAVREAFQESNRVLAEQLAAVGPDQWDWPTWSRLRPIPIRLQAEIRVAELALHGWDIRSVFDPPGHLNPVSLPVLLDWLNFWLERAFRPNPGQKEAIRLRFDFHDPALHSRDLVLEATSFRYEAAAPEPADVTLHCTPEVAVLLAAGRIDPARARDTHGLKVSGDSALSGLLATRFPPF